MSKAADPPVITIPIVTKGHHADALVIVLGEANVARMREADPVELVTRDTGKELVNPTILLCLEADQRSLARFIQAHDLEGLLEYLQRGWKFRPERGDHDRGPESIYKQQ